jgi:outer membrane biogenesis lipoprotein LolB
MLTNKLTGQALFKGGIKAVVLIVVTILLMACSPKLDWRTVQSPQEGYIALFPAKPEKIERKVSYQAQELLQTLEAAKLMKIFILLALFI